MYNDNKIPYYKGRTINANNNEPLYDFGKSNAGCTSIIYTNKIKLNNKKIIATKETIKENTNEFYDKLGGNLMVIMKKTNSLEEIGDTLTFDSGTILSSWIHDSSSSVDMNHSYGDPKEWEMVGLNINEEEYKNKKRNHVPVGKDQWNLYHIYESLKNGSYKFIERNDYYTRWIKNFIELIDNDEEEENIERESSLNKKIKMKSSIENETIEEKKKEIEYEFTIPIIGEYFLDSSVDIMSFLAKYERETYNYILRRTEELDKKYEGEDVNYAEEDALNEMFPTTREYEQFSYWDNIPYGTEDSVIKDFNEAKLEQYIDEDSKIHGKIISIRAIKIDYREMYVTVIANEELEKSEINEIIEYFEGQCSDGWGEGFEQQDFNEDYYNVKIHTWWHNEDGYKYPGIKFVKGKIKE